MIPFLGLKNLLTTLIGALVALSPRARAQLGKNLKRNKNLSMFVIENVNVIWKLSLLRHNQLPKGTHVCLHIIGLKF